MGAVVLVSCAAIGVAWVAFTLLQLRRLGREYRAIKQAHADAEERARESWRRQVDEVHVHADRVATRMGIADNDLARARARRNG